MSRYTNRYGRRGGRGLRPYLLIPKVLSVAVFFGGTVVASVVALFPPGAWEHRRAWVELLGLMFRGVIVPALIAALLLGAALLYQHGRTLLRMRWLRVKLITLVIAVPALHWFLSAQLGRLREVAAPPVGPDAAAGWADGLALLRAGLLAAVLVGVLLIVLGRHKPRLAQPIRPQAGAGGERQGGEAG